MPGTGRVTSATKRNGPEKSPVRQTPNRYNDLSFINSNLGGGDIEELFINSARVRKELINRNL